MLCKQICLSQRREKWLICKTIQTIINVAVQKNGYLTTMMTIVMLAETTTTTKIQTIMKTKIMVMKILIIETKIANAINNKTNGKIKDVVVIQKTTTSVPVVNTDATVVFVTFLYVLDVGNKKVVKI